MGGEGGSEWGCGCNIAEGKGKKVAKEEMLGERGREREVVIMGTEKIWWWFEEEDSAPVGGYLATHMAL